MLIGSASNPVREELTRVLEPDAFFDYRRSSSEEIRGNVAAYAAELGRGDGADVVIETSGSADAFPFGLTLLRTRGRYFVPGQYSEPGACFHCASHDHIPCTPDFRKRSVYHGGHRDVSGIFEDTS